MTAMLAGWLQLHGWEALAVLLGIAYLLLAMRESLWCWPAAFLSTLIYLFLFWHAELPMESGLQFYYLAMAVYGWWHWRGGAGAAAEPLPVRTWPWRYHVAAIVLVLAASLASGAALTHAGLGRLPYLDSFTTWGAILTTWMVAQKLLENWLYWLVVDGVSLYLYLDRGLHLTALLFVVYLVIVVFGYFQWRRHYREQHAASDAPRAG
ncbi:MAG: nicotinamide mononucleotide transporter [Gammaproteobacteria bacterium]|nr:nicotinamide mononucleotide transporter [Gammaproteobacteria bacterium]MBK8991602.1 nicotinamide mononucleotide transporter [Gammaproteobacteria bacterium]MBK9470144.1 nicotinamide mononucleotide transporter [Gammaproteobacteria bacterium]MBP6480612.1 nicotinamide mononucleotide transporter [Pseudomonadales bacterium]MBP7911275.1 nicotinamide mononucleotide transporter [Pseudomonadales bacterium]